MSDDQEQEKTNANTIESLEEDSPVTDAGSSVQDELAGKTEECKALNDKYLRLAAEFENYKRLTQRDQREQIRFGNEQLLKELLSVVDNMERAVKAARTTNGGDSALVQGVELTLKQLSGILAKFGVQAVETAGQDFDPSAHQAVSYGPSNDVPANKVLDEFQKGYRLHDRILRAAMVSVSSGPAQPSEHDSTTN